jgi:hypothetical protein
MVELPSMVVLDAMDVHGTKFLLMDSGLLKIKIYFPNPNQDELNN